MLSLQTLNLLVIQVLWLLLVLDATARSVLPIKAIKTKGICDICGLTFRNVQEYKQHIAGKRHADQLKKTPTSEQLWYEFSSGAPAWSEGCSPEDITPHWMNDELSSLNFKYRQTCLHPSHVISDLKPLERARMWRYMREAMGYSYYTEIATIMAAIDADADGHLRVKEVFESFESYRKIVNFIVAAQKTARETGNPAPKRIVELACGHGLVGVLLAYRFHQLDVHLYDIHKRPTFDAFIRAFEQFGTRRPDNDKVLPNIHFHETDLANSVDMVPDSIVFGIHACGDLNRQMIELAIDNKAAGWLVMPCCITKDMYLGSSCKVIVSDDDARHALLVGALASQYRAQLVDSIDSRITNRAIVVAGGVGSTDRSSGYDRGQYLNNCLKRGRMPKLILS